MNWRKAAACSTADGCIEVVQEGDQVFVRDSHQPDVVLNFSMAMWTDLVAGVKNGDFDDLVELETNGN